MAKVLALYYSRKGQNYGHGGILTLAKGSTEIAAEYIAAAVDGTLFELGTVTSMQRLFLPPVQPSVRRSAARAAALLCGRAVTAWPQGLAFSIGPCGASQKGGTT